MLKSDPLSYCAQREKISNNANLKLYMRSNKAMEIWVSTQLRDTAGKTTQLGEMVYTLPTTADKWKCVSVEQI